MSEVPRSQRWADEMDAQTQVLDMLRMLIGSTPVSLLVFDPPSWDALLQKLGEIEEWIGDQVGALQTVGSKTILRSENLKLLIQVWPSKKRRIWTANEQGETSKNTVMAEAEMAAAIVRRIEGKLRRKNRSGNWQTRPRPRIRPCHLVLYPNTGSIGLDILSLIPRVRSNLTLNVSKHFDEVWLSSESGIDRVL